MTESRAANRERHVPLALVRIDQEQRGGGSKRCAGIRQVTRIGRHAQLRLQTRERLCQAAAQFIRQRSQRVDYRVEVARVDGSVVAFASALIASTYSGKNHPSFTSSSRRRVTFRS